MTDTTEDDDFFAPPYCQTCHGSGIAPVPAVPATCGHSVSAGGGKGYTCVRPSRHDGPCSPYPDRTPRSAAPAVVPVADTTETGTGLPDLIAAAFAAAEALAQLAGVRERAERITAQHTKQGGPWPSGKHKFRPETTNGGNCFADCSCGWGGGVHPSRPTARNAWQAHVDGAPRVAPIAPVLLYGPPAGGQSAREDGTQ